MIKTANKMQPAHPLSERILLVDMITGGAQPLADKLHSHQFQIVGALSDVNGLLKQVECHQPDVLLMTVTKLSKAVLTHLFEVHKYAPLPVIVLAQEHCEEVMNCVLDHGVTSYIVDDVQASRLPVIIELAKARFAQLRQVLSELELTKNKLSERKLIDRAKGIIMEQKKLSEEQAYAQLRRSAMNQGQTIADIAKRIIAVFDMLD